MIFLLFDSLLSVAENEMPAVVAKTTLYNNKNSIIDWYYDKYSTYLTGYQPTNINAWQKFLGQYENKRYF